MPTKAATRQPVPRPQRLVNRNRALKSGTFRRKLAAAIAADGRPNYLISAAVPTSPSRFSTWVNGTTDPTPEQMARLAEILDRPVAVLFGDQPLVVTP